MSHTRICHRPLFVAYSVCPSQLSMPQSFESFVYTSMPQISVAYTSMTYVTSFENGRNEKNNLIGILCMLWSSLPRMETEQKLFFMRPDIYLLILDWCPGKKRYLKIRKLNKFIHMLQMIFSLISCI